MVNATATDDKAIYEITGKADLKEGSIVLITVADQEKKQKFYRITIKEAEKNVW